MKRTGSGVESNQGMRSPRLFWKLFLALLVVGPTLTSAVLQVVHITEENTRSSALLESSLLSSVSRFDYLPELLAVDARVQQQLRQPDSDSANRYLAFVTTASEADKIFVLDAQGVVVASSNHSDSDHSFVGQDYSFRPYFRQTLMSGSRQYYFGKGVTTGIPGFFIAEPVAVDGAVAGVVVVKLELSDLLESWRSASDLVLVSDQQNVVILSSHESWMYRLVDDVPASVLTRIRHSRQFPDETHSLLYSRHIHLSLPLGMDIRFWRVDRDWYLVQGFPLADQDWRLFHLIAVGYFLEPVMYVLASSLLLAVLAWLLLLEREKRLGLRRMVQEAEARRLQDLQRLIDNIHIGVVLFDQQGDIRSVNRYAENLLQLRGQPVGERCIRDRLALAAEVDFSRYLVDPLRTLQYHETTVCSGEDRIPVMFALAEVEYADQPRYLMTLVNITKRKRAEEALVVLNESLESTVQERTSELEHAQQALVQKSKTLALGNMAATIVHELSQPLSAINSSVAAIEHKSLRQNWVGVGESVSRLKPLTIKMARVVQMLKNFSYENAEDVASIHLAQWLEEALESRRDQLLEKGVDVTIQSNTLDDAARLRISLLKLDLVFSNLMGNALDAVEKVANPMIEIELAQENDCVSLSVQDNGSGIDDAIMGQLFSPYFTTKGIGKGLGLGLSIVNEIAQQLGGSISACNRNDGARFTVRLPLELSEHTEEIHQDDATG